MLHPSIYVLKPTDVQRHASGWGRAEAEDTVAIAITSSGAREQTKVRLATAAARRRPEEP